jgi:uncharacterized membrane protein
MSQSVTTRRKWYHPREIALSFWVRPRLLMSVLAGIGAFILLPHSLKPAVKWALAWDIGGLVYLAASLQMVFGRTGKHIKARAARVDDNGFVILALILVAILSSFAAITGLAGEAKDAVKSIKLLYLGLAAATLFISWLVTQVVFTIHYAHHHYGERRDAGEHGSLIFPEDDQPDYWDFFYFATSIGATSQTSDVEIRSKSMRRLVTVHAIISFFFNTMVLAITINIAAGLI